MADATCCGTAGDRPADGMSFNFANDLPNGTFTPSLPCCGAEDGAGTGLTISFDAWDNGAGNDTDAPAIEVIYGGQVKATVSLAGVREGGRAPLTAIPTDPATGQPMSMFTTGLDYADVVVRLDQDGTVDVSYKGVVVLENVTTGYVPTAGRFGFGARTGGANQTHWVDDLEITLGEESSGALLEEDFNAGDGGFTVQNGIGAAATVGAEGWTYNAGTGSWRANGGEGVKNSTLNTPALTLTQAGEVKLTFNHRYNFEDDGTIRWDGGAIFVSVNGGAYAYVPKESFLANGYVEPRAITGNSPPLNGLFGFNNTSAGFSAGSFITSVATLGTFAAGDAISVRFLGAWDEGFVQTPAPNWE
ncbi:MAG TPA: hypothetical protein VLD18_02330, partial [Verrucomicrobiae bacterium]|nr:hypothetical protein [Verrucomicrobiae bacterium]